MPLKRDCESLEEEKERNGVEVEGGEEEEVMVTPGEVLGKSSKLIAGEALTSPPTTKPSTPPSPAASPPSIPLTRSVPSQGIIRSTVEVTGLRSHASVPCPGSIVLARVTKVMPKMASADIMCVDSKSVREKFSGTIRQQDVRATEIDKVDMHSSFRPGDIVKALVVSLHYFLRICYALVSETCYHDELIRNNHAIVNLSAPSLSFSFLLSGLDARAYYLSTAKNELGVVSAESMAGASMVPISWTEMQCPVTGQIEQRKVAKVGR
ncbi:hypothetical protein Syun_030148 [Stephania yunnanensis]|uniref:Exosome complex component CSL4 C-terminal domain-containing protein n=1 Tax=Stephania yunnanensis TaxID=152371 RepID=A0AAP0E700_9MAGN